MRVGEFNPSTRRTRSTNLGANRGLPVLVEDENSDSESGEARRSTRRRTAGGSGFR